MFVYEFLILQINNLDLFEGLVSKKSSVLYIRFSATTYLQISDELPRMWSNSKH